MKNQYQPSIRQELYRWLYTCVLLLLIPFITILGLSRKLTGKAASKRQRQRLGLLPQVKQRHGLLVHCVSVGEVVTAAKLLKVIMQQRPDLAITITTTTATGAQQVRNLFADKVQHFYLPYDIPLIMDLMLKRVQPSQVLITEVELWPNMIHACWRKSIPVTIINARMTDKSVRAYQKIIHLFQPMLHKIEHVCAQGKRDFNNYQKLGLSRDKLSLSNNIKFDLELTESDQQSIQELRQELAIGKRAVFIAGSTHEPEEKVLLHSYQQLQQEFDSLLFILVPRHPQRFDKVYQLCQELGLATIRMSQQQSCQIKTQVILGDTLGQLNNLYGLADFAYIGGSIAERGGHNPLEAAIHGLPVLMGPHTYNNPEICQLLQQAGVLHPAENSEDITEIARQWLNSSQELALQADKAKAVVNQNAGAVAATLKVLFAH